MQLWAVNRVLLGHCILVARELLVFFWSVEVAQVSPSMCLWVFFLRFYGSVGENHESDSLKG